MRAHSAEHREAVRVQAAASAALAHREQLDPLDVSLAQLRDLSGRLPPSERALLKRAWRAPLDLADVDMDAETLGWLVYYNLVDLHVDRADRTWLRTTRLGHEVAEDRAAAHTPKR